MRVTIEHREEPTVLGKRSFYVDCTVQFSEKEKAVIVNRQLGRHCIVVDSDIPTGKGISFFGYGAWGLRVASRLLALAAALSIFPIALGFIQDTWCFVLAVGSFAIFAYRKHAERQFTTSLEERRISLADMVKKSRFTVYAPDAFNAQETEKSICVQLHDLKERMVAVAPGLSEKQVYDYGR